MTTRTMEPHYTITEVRNGEAGEGWLMAWRWSGLDVWVREVVTLPTGETAPFTLDRRVIDVEELERRLAAILPDHGPYEVCDFGWCLGLRFQDNNDNLLFKLAYQHED